MVDRLLQTTSSTTLTDAASTLCYVGDSVNDGPLWARAGLAVGVANVAPLLQRLQERQQAPRYLVEGKGGHGFAQVVDALVSARSVR
jgi:3-deoxy-D-manno-octulosonate 8-phosphate phosphatase KdsC-like HAD superfamily phosphatase